MGRERNPKNERKHSTHSNKTPDPGRRSFLKGLAVGTAAGAVSMTVNSLFGTTVDILFRSKIQAGWDAVTRVFSVYQPNEPLLAGMDRFDAQHVDLIKSLIGFAPGRVIKASGGHDHYLYRGAMHPDNEVALNALMRVFHEMSQKIETDVNGDFGADGSFVCLGSPISNLRSAAFLGYRRIDPAKPELGLERVDDARIRLPISFEMNAEKLRKYGLVGKRGSVHNDPTPEWAIRIGDGDDLLTTEVGKKDYLLVSRLPNLLEHSGTYLAESENVVTIFAGCHGAATGAVRRLFENGDLLGRLNDLSSRSKYWQALLKVDGFEPRLHPITKKTRFEALAFEPKIVVDGVVKID
jgi:hypothetical protein